MTIPERIQQAIQAYYAERATGEDVAALEAWLCEGEAHVRIFAEHGMVEWQLLCEQEKQDATAILALLREAEGNAEPDLSLLQAPSFGPGDGRQDDQPFTLGALWSLAGYLTAKGLRAKAGVIGSIAAVLMLGVALFFALSTENNTQSTPPDITNNSGDTGRDVPAHSQTANPTVAVLTAESDAVWDRRPGQDLFTGQRLTLTQGFAEITTARGAVAILEAPAMIELLDNNNAIRLHAGKLVGICETDSSKGFLVRTAHIDVTDIGTRFGVDATDADTTEVHVLSGEVELTNTQGTTQSLLAGHTARTRQSDAGLELIVEQRLVKNFDAMLASPLIPPNASLADGRPRFQGSNVIWGGAVPDDLRSQAQVSNKLQVFLERKAVQVPAGLSVNLMPDMSDLNETGIPLATGQRVDVYLLHMDISGDSHREDTYVIHFDRPIVGVITSGAILFDTDRSLGGKGTQYVSRNHEIAISRGIDRIPEKFIDQVSIDGTTIQLELRLSSYMDQVRVLVQAEPTP